MKMGKDKKAPEGGSVPPGTRFEEAMKRLEAIVQELEEGELELDRSLERFEEGVKLSRFCLEKLDEAERKIEMLLREGDQLRKVPLEGVDAPPEEES
jgi:exodeoxyribonuclease VII small subunit